MQEMVEIGKEKYLTTDEAAEILGLAPGSIRRYCNHRINPKIRGLKIGRDWLISEAEVKRFSKENRSVGRPKNE
jgi:excisionase family DNA binding protein